MAAECLQAESLVIPGISSMACEAETCGATEDVTLWDIMFWACTGAEIVTKTNTNIDQIYVQRFSMM